MNLDWLSAFLITGLFSVVMVAGLALLLHLQLGLTRIANFGVVGFFGTGMYVYGVLYVRVDWPFGDPWQFLVCALGGTLAAGIAGTVVGWLIADLDVDAMLLGTFGFATIVFILATTQKSLTGGALGMGGLQFPYKLGTVKANEALWLLILIFIVAGILFYVARVHRSPYGRMLIAIGDNEALARSLGKPAFRAKLLQFTVGSAGMGLLGVMYGVLERFLVNTNLGVELTLAAVVALVLGGTARVWGAVIGAVLTIGVFDIVVQSYLPLPKSWYGQAIPVVKQMVYGATLIVVLLFRPLGILGDMRRDKLMRRVHGA
jgi:branched-chain amino acid transport system permease protein